MIKFIKKVDESPSPYEPLLWVFLVLAYFGWAVLIPMDAKSESAQPLTPLIIIGILGVLYLLNLPHRLGFLVSLSLFSVVVAPAVFLLNIHRAVNNLFPSGWSQSGFWDGPLIFISIQILGLLLFSGNFLYTIKRWKKADESEVAGLKKRVFLGAILLLLILLPVLVFVFPKLFQ